ncbi:DUF4142 domain-containing protein [Streptomyces sp. NPDC051940]|uniref:DUF4142 domain-containing protein n=1 Tax=Streptomyces sp. NPDC051940 TaxID=3155675 RepID=UPI0034308D67
MRTATGTALVIGALAATLAALLFPILTFRAGPGAPADLDADTVATRFGPLSAADRDFVLRVRLAGLWELPAGQQAQQRGTTEAVREAGSHLVEGHTRLDASVRRVAARLGVELPNQPSPQQRAWLTELAEAHGPEYERKFANILRLAHGKVFAVVAQIRATTRNSLVRALADEANATVLDHITVLENTGLVDFDAIAADAATTSPAPTPGRPTAAPRPPVAATPQRTYPLPPPATPPERSDRPRPGSPGPENKPEKK